MTLEQIRPSSSHEINKIHNKINNKSKFKNKNVPISQYIFQYRKGQKMHTHTL